jgi:hypothetical protein
MVRNSSSRKVLLTILVGLVWLTTLAWGLRSLFSYESTPGASGNVPQSWPLQSRIVRSDKQATLVMLAHPHCPCTRASVGELAQIMAQCGGRLRAYVLFLKPENSGPEWDDTRLRRTAAAIPGVTVLSDLGGAEAKRFGAETSGQTVLFDASGNRLFSGGITASRGHAGDNAGESAIVALVNGHTVDQSSALVFGCRLTTDND